MPSDTMAKWGGFLFWPMYLETVKGSSLFWKTVRLQIDPCAGDGALLENRIISTFRLDDTRMARRQRRIVEHMERLHRISAKGNLFFREQDRRNKGRLKCLARSR